MECECFTFLYGNAAGFAFGECFLSEGIGDDDAVVAAVKPTGVKVFRIGHDGDADEAIAQHAGVITPCGGFAPGVLCAGESVAIADGAAIFF